MNFSGVGEGRDVTEALVTICVQWAGAIKAATLGVGLDAPQKRKKGQ